MRGRCTGTVRYKAYKEFAALYKLITPAHMFEYQMQLALLWALAERRTTQVMPPG